MFLKVFCTQVTREHDRLSYVSLSTNNANEGGQRRAISSTNDYSPLPPHPLDMLYKWGREPPLFLVFYDHRIL